MNESQPTGAALPLAIEMVDVTVASMKQPDRPVLQNVHWRVAAGDYWAIGGLHASGKSDLLATAAGLLPPLRGTCLVLGNELISGYESDLLKARLAIGMVFQGSRLLSHLTLAENVALPLRYHHNASFAECEDRIRSLLELTGLTGKEALFPGNANRGMQRRAELARALALEPRVVLLDNPLSGADPREMLWWLNLLDQLAAGHSLLRREPLTLVVTGDDLRPWRFRARQFAVLRDHQFIPLGAREEMDRRSEPFLKELLHTEGPP